MKEDARLRTLAHVGISSSAIAPDGKPWGNRITNLKENWEEHGGKCSTISKRGYAKLSRFWQCTMVNGNGTMVYHGVSQPHQTLCSLRSPYRSAAIYDSWPGHSLAPKVFDMIYVNL